MGTVTARKQVQKKCAWKDVLAAETPANVPIRSGGLPRNCTTKIEFNRIGENDLRFYFHVFLKIALLANYQSSSNGGVDFQVVNV